MRFEGQNEFLQFCKGLDRLYPVGQGGEIKQELVQTMHEVGISQRQLWDPNKPDLKLEDDEALWIWGHGNRHRDFIAAGGDEVVSPVELATHLVNKMDRTSTGDIVVWTCWGGYLGGFVEHIAALMRGAGFDGLHFWGASAVTGGLVRAADSEWADLMVFADRGHSLGALALEGNFKGPYYGRRRATKADLNGFGPALLEPYFRHFVSGDEPWQ